MRVSSWSCLWLLALIGSASAADELPARMAALAAAHPGLARTQTLAVSHRGRAVNALVLAAGNQPLTERQGLLLVAGLHGGRLMDGELLLDAAADLLAREDLESALAGQALVFVPRANPDGAETLSGGLSPLRLSVGNRRPDDADRDGRVDEDGPSDLNGDGLITLMAVPDGQGEWVRDEHDPRAFRKHKEDERGTHKLMPEGADDDADGRHNEDGSDGVSVDRNFPHGWPEHDPVGGAYPLSEPESRGLVDFLLAHPGLGAVLVLGQDDTLVSVPNKAGKVQRGGFGGGFRAPLDGLLEDDLGAMKALGKLLKDAGGDKPHEVKADGPVDGSLLAWAYHQGGRWPLGVCAWQAPEKLPEPEKAEAKGGEAASEGGEAAQGDGDDASAAGDTDSAAQAPADELSDEAASDGDDDDSHGDEPAGRAEGKADDKDDDKPGSDKTSPVPAAVLAWLDKDHDGAGIVPWSSFAHPEFGAVEIGGLAPGVLLNPPSADVQGKAALVANLALAVVAAAPKLAFEEVKLTAHGGGLVTVSAVLVNTGALPTCSVFASDASLARPVRVRPVLPDGVQRVHGPTQTLVRRLAGHGGRHELRWQLAGVTSGQVLRLAVDADCVPDFELELTLP